MHYFKFSLASVVMFFGLSLFSFNTVHAASADTPEGLDVEVVINKVTITFSEVTQAGVTEVVISDAGPDMESGFAGGDSLPNYNISTTALYSGPIKICVIYSEDVYNEADVRLVHYEDDQWVDITVQLDNTNNFVCGVTDSFSEFAPAVKTTPETLGSIIHDLDTQTGIKKSLLKKINNANKAETGAKLKILDSLVNELSALSGKKLTEEQAGGLMDYVKGLISLSLK